MTPGFNAVNEIKITKKLCVYLSTKYLKGCVNNKNDRVSLFHCFIAWSVLIYLAEWWVKELLPSKILGVEWRDIQDDDLDGWNEEQYFWLDNTHALDDFFKKFGLIKDLISAFMLNLRVYSANCTSNCRKLLS